MGTEGFLGTEPGFFGILGTEPGFLAELQGVVGFARESPWLGRSIAMTVVCFERGPSWWSQIRADEAAPCMSRMGTEEDFELDFVGDFGGLGDRLR